jgi:photosystem II stability/assembly factor-like uncharacterized protein
MRQVFLILLVMALAAGGELVVGRPLPLVEEDDGGGFLTAESLDNTITAIDDSGELVWIGTLKNFGKSNDGGANWTAYGYDDGLPGSAANVGTARIAENGEVFLGCFFPRYNALDPLVGAGLARTKDGGSHWEQFTTDDGFGSNMVWDTESDGDGKIWAACQLGGVAFSANDGGSWSQLKPGGSDGAAFGNQTFAVEHTEDYLIVGTAAGLAISEDNGGSWINHEPPPVTLGSYNYYSSRIVGFVEAERISSSLTRLWVGTVSEEGRWFGLWRVNLINGVPSWRAYPASEVDGVESDYIYWIQMAPDNNVWIATVPSGGVGGGLLHTSNSGSAWETITGRGLYTNSLYSVSTTDNQTIWVGTPLGLQVSRDGAANFDIIDFQPRSGFIDEPVAYAFPNPFSPLSHGGCTFRFSVSGDPLQHDTVVDLDIYDLEGRHVRNILDGELRQGSYEYQLDTWDGNDESGRRVANGLYYYVIKSDGVRAFIGKLAVIE